MDEESRWIRRICAKADKAAADSLINKYDKEVYAYVLRQAADKELSMDLTQDIFVAALRTLEGFDERRASFRTWLYRIATNKIVDYFRSALYRHGRGLIPPEELETIEAASGALSADGGCADFTVELERRQDIERITGIVNRLAADDQRIIRLRIFAEYTFRQTAELLNIPESTVKTRYYAVLRHIRDTYEREGMEHADEQRRKRTV